MKNDLQLIKIGGGQDINWDFIAEDLKRLKKFIIIHGANHKITEISKKLGITEKKIISPSGFVSRYTDEKALDVFLMIYAGLVNKKLVALLQKYKINAVGLTGIDGRIWEGKRKNIIYSVENGKTKLINDSLTGNVEKINTNLLNLLVKNGFVPVLCPPAISFDNEIINVDNDRAAAVLTKSLKIKEMIMLLEAPGYCKDLKDPKSVVSKIPFKKLDRFIKIAQSGMKKKLLGVKEAMIGGVEKVYLGDGRVKNPISKILNGAGTLIFKESIYE
ncbi:[LysW]-aminoadipate kinase [Candidatus Gottesmanbacteria bacterium]|nr:[LysW]-aminoadipate kinase [Candidatus Gottesmanbacteria bacterium]